MRNDQQKIRKSKIKFKFKFNSQFKIDINITSQNNARDSTYST